MVKIISSSGKEEKFDSEDIKKDREVAGLPEKVAEEVSERVEDRVQDHWTSGQVWQEVNVEIKRLEGEIERAQNYINARSGQMGQTQEESRMREENNMKQTGSRTETFVPESERERHGNNRY